MKIFKIQFYKFFAFLSLLICIPRAIFAENITPITGPASQVAMFTSYGRHIFNPYLVYGNKIRYYVAPAVGNVFVVIDGITYSFDITQFVIEAMSEWHNALGLNFEQVSSINDASLVVNVDNAGMNNGGLARGVPKGREGNERASITFFAKMLALLTKGDNYAQNQAKLANLSVSNYLRFALKWTAKHELGHVLGFAHTPLTESTPNVGTAIVIRSGTDGEAPIMIANLAYYINHLYRYYYGDAIGNAVNIRQIQIAIQEARVRYQLQNCGLGNYSKKRNVQCDNPIFYHSTINIPVFLMLM